MDKNIALFIFLFFIFAMFITQSDAKDNYKKAPKTDEHLPYRLCYEPFVGGAINFAMIGNKKKYEYMEYEPFVFPDELTFDCFGLPKNEREFLEFLIRNDWVQRMVGIKMFPTNGFFPDIKGFIYDGTDFPIMVEVEYKAENYSRHFHPFGGANLILSYIRYSKSRIIRGCPVWSFYKIENKKLIYCLDEDINFNFNEKNNDSILDDLSISHRLLKKGLNGLSEKQYRILMNNE